jgi:hypothetical protein
MSLTSWLRERRLRRCWRKRVQPAADSMRARGILFLDPPEPVDKESWYVAVDRADEGLVELESGDVARALEELWSRQGLHELAAIAPHVARLAEHLLVEDRGPGELSSDVYAMY